MNQLSIDDKKIKTEKLVEGFNKKLFSLWSYYTWMREALDWYLEEIQSDSFEGTMQDQIDIMRTMFAYKGNFKSSKELIEVIEDKEKLKKIKLDELTEQFIKDETKKDVEVQYHYERNYYPKYFYASLLAFLVGLFEEMLSEIVLILGYWNDYLIEKKQSRLPNIVLLLNYLKKFDPKIDIDVSIDSQFSGILRVRNSYIHSISSGIAENIMKQKVVKDKVGLLDQIDINKKFFEDSYKLISKISSQLSDHFSL